MAEEKVETVRQMIAYLKQKLEMLGFVMAFLSFHPADNMAEGQEVIPPVYHIINMAGYHPNKALIVGVSFQGGSAGLHSPPVHFHLLGELKPRENVYPGDIHEELEPFGLPGGMSPQFEIEIDERSLPDNIRCQFVPAVDEACVRIQRLVTGLYEDVIVDRFTTELYSFLGFVPQYSDEHLRRWQHREKTPGLHYKYTDRPYVWAALQTFPDGYINYDPK
ncbi:MAG: hypothetical protein KGJ93_04285 [Patescibacteria group bacterium]|nr:hypothetical protein [Patescibacteria group bacterium]